VEVAGGVSTVVRVQIHPRAKAFVLKPKPSLVLVSAKKKGFAGDVSIVSGNMAIS
jgi:hypothetical protein